MKEEEVWDAPICEPLDRKRKLKDLVPELQGTKLPEFELKVDLTNNLISKLVKTEEAVGGSDSDEYKTKRPHLEDEPHILGQMKQPMSLMQQPNPIQQVIEKSSTLLQQQNMTFLINQQKQLFQSRRASTSLDSTAGNGDEGDWQEEVYQKIKSLKEIYFLELLEMYQKISSKLQLQESLAGELTNRQLERFKTFRIMLERLISFLQLSRSQISPTLKDKVAVYEKQLIQVINANRSREPDSSMQANSMYPLSRVLNLQHNSLVLVSPKAGFVRENVGDRQEEIYQKINSMKEMYLVELSGMYKKISDKLQQHESLSQQPYKERLEKLKTFKIMLGRFISFLQLSRSQISPTLKDKVVLYEKQIIQVINSNRSHEPDSSMQANSMYPLSGVLNLQHNSLVLVSPKAGFVRENVEDFREEIYQKINSMKGMYFVELSEMYKKISDKLQRHESLSQQPYNERLEKFKRFKVMLGRLISFLQLSRSQISPTLKDKVVLYEKQIIQVINSKRFRKPDSSMQPNPMHPLSGVLHLHHNLLVQVSPQAGFVRKNIGDIQEEVYQKINSMKEMYFVELSEMYQKISDKLQQREYLSQQTNNEPFKKFKTFKIMLERLISFLQLSRSQISPTLEDKVVLYEKQIIQVINSNRRGKHPSLIQ